MNSDRPRRPRRDPSPRVVGPGFHERVYAVVRRVPRGRVATYGDVATFLGSPRVARHVGWALAALRAPDVPWHRVLSGRGTISDGGDPARAELQRRLLEAEGVTLDPAGRVDLARLRWRYGRRRSRSRGASLTVRRAPGRPGQRPPDRRAPRRESSRPASWRDRRSDAR